MTSRRHQQPPTRLNLPRRQHHLLREPLPGNKHRAQTLMTAHHIGQRRPNAATSTSPHNRNATGMLYTDDGPCNCSINHNRDCANDNGTTTGRCWTTNGATTRRPA